MPLPPRSPSPGPWSPLTDAEWTALAPFVSRTGPGRPPRNLRATWDAIFWIACARTPWHTLPDHLGKADTAHKALRRAARAGLLGPLLYAVSDRGLASLRSLRWRVCRAARRMARIMPLALTLMAHRLGLSDALPCRPHQLPKPHLSETLGYHGRFLRDFRLYRTLIPYLRAVHRLWAGDIKAWRLTA